MHVPVLTLDNLLAAWRSGLLALNAGASEAAMLIA